MNHPGCSTSRTASKSLLSLVRGFVNRSPAIRRGLHNAEWAKGTCEHVAADLSHFLARHGEPAQLVALTGLRQPLPRDSHPDWRRFAGAKRRFLWHVMAETAAGYLDLTGVQYGRRFQGVRHLSRRQLEREWSMIVPWPMPALQTTPSTKRDGHHS